MQYYKAVFGLLLTAAFLGITSSPINAQSVAANFTLSSSNQSLVIGKTVQTVLGLQLGTSTRITGLDAIMTYDSTVISISPAAFPSTGKLFTSNVIKTPNPTGTLSYSSTNTQAGTYFQSTITGTNPYAQFTITALKAGQTVVRFTCTQGATNDSNIVEFGTGADLVNCASLPTLTVTVTAPTPTPSPTPVPTPVPTPTPTPLVIPVCLTISADVSSPKFGDSVRFTCGQVAGATSYAFRYRVVETNTSGTIASISTASNISQPLVMSKVGSYDVECQACKGAVCSPYTAW